MRGGESVCVREREIKSEEGKMSLNGLYEEITKSILQNFEV